MLRIRWNIYSMYINTYAYKYMHIYTHTYIPKIYVHSNYFIRKYPILFTRAHTYTQIFFEAGFRP
jgi:hypothetical protein